MTDLIIPVVARRGRESWSLTFRCSWCNRVHSHGGGPTDQPPAAGHRVSHCASELAPSGYTLKVVAIEGAISPPASANPEMPA